MARRLALAALTLSSMLVLAFSLVGGRAAEIGFALAAVAFPVFLMVVGGARRDGSLGSIAWPIGALLVTLEGCLVGMLLLTDAGSWALGLPPAAAIQLYLLFLLPLFLVVLGYALTFDDFGVGDDDLARLREEAARRADD